MLKKLWIWFKSLWHVCYSFKWEVGYGLTPSGVGRYEYSVCRDCDKIRENSVGQTYIINFVKDVDMYNEENDKIRT